jgi:uncharacterized membrane protein YbhN (UPF0104 family)
MSRSGSSADRAAGEPNAPRPPGATEARRPRPARPLWRRLIPLAVTAVGLYVVWPTLLKTWAAAPSLSDAHPGWFVVMGLLQVASFLCMWFLQRLALATDGMFLVATTQLTANAVSKVVPAGGAAAAALQHQMLVRGGTDPLRSVKGVTFVAVLTNGAVFLMPILALPALFGPTRIAESLVQAAWTGLVIAAALIVVGVVLARSDRLLVLLARLIQGASNLVRRRQETGLPERLAAERTQLLDFLGPRWLRAVAWTTGKIGFDYLSLLAALAAVGADPEPALVVLAYVAAMVLASIPITPGGLGFVEAGLTATLTVAGIPASAAATATLAYRLASYWLPLLAGVPAYLLFVIRYGTVPLPTAATADGAADG